MLPFISGLFLADVLTDIYIVSGPINKCADVEFERWVFGIYARRKFISNTFVSSYHRLLLTYRDPLSISGLSILFRGAHLGSVHENGAHYKREVEGNYCLSPAHKCVLAAAIPWFCERLTKSTFKVL